MFDPIEPTGSDFLGLLGLRTVPEGCLGAPTNSRVVGVGQGLNWIQWLLPDLSGSPGAKHPQQLISKYH